MTAENAQAKFYAEYDLSHFRDEPKKKEPAVHQQTALGKLQRWYADGKGQGRGGLLVLPTGGGKTFTAVHFTCSIPLTEGAKVLWLAHTHHLLDQTFAGFADVPGLVGEPKQALRIRVVSGMEKEHFPVHSIRPADDVVISSLPTACRALKNRHEALLAFLDSSQGKLLVVFDEAHHAPAPTHRQLLRELRDRYPGLVVLGLTATPTYGNARKQGWLLELFPQGIVHQVTATELMTAGILAKPVMHDERTSFTPTFSDRDYQKWLGTHADIPEQIITALANNRDRNDHIIGSYVTQKDKWGKTIIFADRWYQCDYLREGLRQRGVRADAVYSHVDSDPGSAEARSKRDPSENSRVLKAFRENELDVLINVRMLTEGTDVPDCQTVFLTRQTTSRILLNQMVGRALRGPKFGGTAEAHIVSFIDDWKQGISWAAYDQLAEGEKDDKIRELRKHPPVHLVSIDLVRRLARQMDSGNNVNTLPYRQMLPVGWYLADYNTRVGNGESEEQAEQVRQQVLVFEHNKDGFRALLASMVGADLRGWEESNLSLEAASDQLEKWREQHFGGSTDHVGSDFNQDLVALGRHMAQNDRQLPIFVPFDGYKSHDLDEIAHVHIEENRGILESNERLRKEYVRKDRFWSVFYPSYQLFKCQYDGCVNRLLNSLTGPGPSDPSQGVSHPEVLPDLEPPDDSKKFVKSRHGRRCLCCGGTSPLQVDHIIPRYLGGTHDPENLQTLCKYCNQDKGILRIDFRKKKTPLKEPPALVFSSHGRDAAHWEFYLRATLNLFYRCAAVETVEIGKRGEKFIHWRVMLRSGNDPKWIKPHLIRLAQHISDAREQLGLTPAPKKITVTSGE